LLNPVFDMMEQMEVLAEVMPRVAAKKVTGHLPPVGVELDIKRRKETAMGIKPYQANFHVLRKVRIVLK
jgi:hypothetical protein